MFYYLYYFWLTSPLLSPALNYPVNLVNMLPMQAILVLNAHLDICKFDGIKYYVNILGVASKL